MSLQEIDRPAVSITEARSGGVKERRMVRGNADIWQENSDHFWSANKTCETLTPGVYETAYLQSVGHAIKRMTANSDELLDLPDAPSGDAISEIRRFWTLRSAFESRGLIFKRGVLLWGPAGTGKSATVRQLAQMVVDDHDGLTIFATPNIAAGCLQLVRKIEPETPIVCVLEDIDEMIKGGHETHLLSLLDGEAQIPNIVFVATTNYVNRLPARLSDRPSRFDLIMKIGYPTEAARRAYLSAKEPSLVGAELAAWVGATEGFSIAHLRELIILCRCYKQPLETAVERLNRMRKGAGKGDE